jgi:drug/metabolite transporter (DMT)-like permease
MDRVLLACLGVSLVWGITNPFLRDGTLQKQKVHPSIDRVLHRCPFWLANILSVVLNYRWFIPFILNQLGGLVFTVILGSNSAPITITAPVTNALTLVITFITGYLVFGEKLSYAGVLGSLFILVGVSICVHSQFEHS